MRIDPKKCKGCGRCADVCAVGGCQVYYRCRDEEDGHIYYRIDEDECVDCGLCLKICGCETGALYSPEVGYPRIVRAQFSNPVVEHPKTEGHGRGTEEMKTNEVTAWFLPGHVGIFVEFGRPSIGARFKDVEKVSTRLAALGVEFEEANPCTALMDDPSKGTFKKEVLNEKVLSTILEMSVPIPVAEQVLTIIKEMAPEMNCVASVALASLFDEKDDGFHYEGKDILEHVGWTPRPNGKLNTGLGRPLAPAFSKGQPDRILGKEI